jgi:hypothetical protein
MRTQVADPPKPPARPAPLSAEDRAIIEQLELLEQLGLLENWDAEQELAAPEADAAGDAP